MSSKEANKREIKHNAVSWHSDISVNLEFQIKLEDSSNNYIGWQTRSRGKHMWQEVTNHILQKSIPGLTLLRVILRGSQTGGKVTSG